MDPTSVELVAMKLGKGRGFSPCIPLGRSQQLEDQIDRTEAKLDSASKQINDLSTLLKQAAVNIVFGFIEEDFDRFVLQEFLRKVSLISLQEWLARSRR